MDKKPTRISTPREQPLDVEWAIRTPHKRLPDGTFKPVTAHKIVLVHPATSFLSEETRRVPLVELSVETALNLLAWLREEEDRLMELAEQEAS
jgi:hypothetical protein